MDVAKLSKKLGSKHAWLREILAEFLGTFLLVFMGINAIAFVVFNHGGSLFYFLAHYAFGFGAAFGVLVAGGVSGAHLNPAITVAMVIIGRLKWTKMFHYIVGQYLGSFFAAVMTFLLYNDALEAFDGGRRAVSGPTATAGIWATYPQSYMTLLGSLADQIVGTFILSLVFCGITDKKNLKVPKNLVALYVGLLLTVIGTSIGMNCGAAINPARDLAPRLFLLTCGWGTKAFTVGKFHFWWIPIVGPHIGAILGALIYVFCVEIHIPKEAVEAMPAEGHVT